MSQVQVETSLAQDSTINLLALGYPLQITIRNVASKISGDEDSLSSNQEQVIVAIATRQLTGMSCDSAIDVSVGERGDYVVTFKPDVPDVQKQEDFTLTIFCRGDHVQGSPFFIQLVEPLALCSVHTEKKHVVMDAGEPINIIVPLVDKNGIVDVSVEGPFGSCAVETNHLAGQSVSANFMPKGVGAYSVHVTLDNKEIEKSPFLMLADFSAEEALDCHVLEEDKHLFNLPVKLSEEGICFRVSTAKVLFQSQNLGELNVICSGPGKTDVKISKDPNDSSLEVCEVIPSVPGDYRLNLLWKEHHITGSPYTVRFMQPRKGAISMDLHEQDYKLGVSHRFEFNCSGMDEGGKLDIHSIPSTAADITIRSKEGCNGVYKCELLPKEIGEHAIVVKYNDIEMTGSPYVVTFDSDGDPLACKMIQSSKNYEKGGCLSMKITTEGAGPGILEATAEDSNNSTTIPVRIKGMPGGVLYNLEFDPGQSAACKLNVTYNKQDIQDSPFKLIFSDPNSFKVKGDGILGGQVGVWNSFMVQATDPPLGKLRVHVDHDDDDDDGLQVETEIVSRSVNRFEVRYSPKSSGKYKINAFWGPIPIPGSPFPVYFSSTIYEVKDRPKKVYVGSPLEFKIHLVSASETSEGKDLEVTARTSKNEILKGSISLVDKEKDTYSYAVVPRINGKHIVSVKWNHIHVKGSPFFVKVLTPPMPEKVRVYGSGVENGLIEAIHKKFTVETNDAGCGLLAIRVQGPGPRKELKFNGTQDKENNRTIHVDYQPLIPGEYTVGVEWARIHAPGSPFKIEFLNPSTLAKVTQRGTSIVSAEVHPVEIAVEMEKWEDESPISLDKDEMAMGDAEKTRAILPSLTESTYGNNDDHLSLCISQDEAYNGRDDTSSKRNILLCDTRMSSMDSTIGSDLRDITQMKREVGDSTDDEISIHIEGDMSL